ncbi:glycosyltransferase family 4 protein [Aporhodopirellula aestuarii]|uniref:Glycosyltransferase family 4 protein n=1 Tax=Aporhodopirellula aestuarii TaxID=2950107 RepID=A0ABT0U2X2_9BACT|nr:glycosyltransferase family 4 protein [Aporhodopirellula aestuarii]MCM2371217.1 glycosyltransferase family 4 protein [Aporhodopirellula aestuarii]
MRRIVRATINALFYLLSEPSRTRPNVMRIMLSTPIPELIEHLEADPQMQVSWLATRDQVERYRAMGVGGQSYEYTVGRAKCDPRSAMEMRRAIQEEKPDLLHAFYGRAMSHSVLATSAMRQRPLLVSFRGITSRLHRFDPSDWLTYLNPRFVGHACESNAVRDAMVASGIAAERCYVTYNRVPPVQPKVTREELLSRLGVPPSAFVIGTVATMRPVKGIDVLLNAAIECSDLDDVHVLLVGSVKDKRVEQLIQNSEMSSRIHAIGYHANAPEFLPAMNLFVMPSRQEALCLALLEAISCGVCPVVSDAGGLPEVVRHEVDGLVFQKEDVAGLAAAIRRLHHDRTLIERLACSAKQRSEEFFSAERWCERVEKMYRSVLAKHRPGALG